MWCSAVIANEMNDTQHNVIRSVLYGLVWHKSDENATVYSAFTTKYRLLLFV